MFFCPNLRLGKLWFFGSYGSKRKSGKAGMLKTYQSGHAQYSFKEGVWFLERKNGTAMAVLAVPAPTALVHYRFSQTNLFLLSTSQWAKG